MKHKLEYENVKLVEVSDWDSLVSKIYGKPYNFQQQDGRRERGIYYLQVPNRPMDYTSDKDVIESGVNASKKYFYGVSFECWLNRDPNESIVGQTEDYELETWWERNFYPDIDMVAQDLYNKGLLEEGTYVINIDW